MRKIKIKILSLLALLALSPMLMGAGSGGFPSRPKFSVAHIDSNEPLTGVNTTFFIDNHSVGGGLRFTVHPFDGSNVFIGSAGYMKNLAWTSENPDQQFMSINRSAFDFYNNHGTTPGSSYTPTRRFSISDLGVVALTNSLTSSKACATNFTRIAANYCLKTSGADIATALDTAACTQTTAISGLSDGVAVDFAINHQIVSQNSVARRSSNVSRFDPTDTTCATARETVNHEVYEHVAVAAETILSKVTHRAIAKTNTSGQAYFKYVGDVYGTTFKSGVSLLVIGYYD